jgi:hypothetical protein
LAGSGHTYFNGKIRGLISFAIKATIFMAETPTNPIAAPSRRKTPHRVLRAFAKNKEE